MTRRRGGSASERLLLVGVGLVAALALLGGASSQAAPAWLGPQDISKAGGDALGPQIALDQRGNAVAVWARSSGTSWAIESASRPVGGTWRRPIELTRAGDHVGSPQVAFDPAGNVVAVWERFDGENIIVQASVRSAATGRWGKPRNLSQRGEDAVTPEVAVDPQGNATAVWARTNGLLWTIQAAYRPAGGAWQAPEDLGEPAEGAAAPKVAVDAVGNAIVVWSSLRDSSWAIQAAYRPARGAWQEAKDLSGPSRNAVAPEIAMDGRGNAVAVWARSNGTSWAVQSASKPAGGDWRRAESLSRSGGDAVAPHVAVDSRGAVVAVWARSSAASTIVQTSYRRAATRLWGPPRNVSEPAKGALAPQVAVDPEGSALAVWTRSDGGNTVVQASYRPAATGTWGKPRNLSEPGGDAVGPQIAFDAQGNAALVWSRFDGRNFLAEAVAYDVAGPQLNGLALPERGLVGDVLRFSVSPLDAWSSVASTRWSFGDGSTASGPRAAHRYARPGRYQVRVTSRDALGNETRASRTVEISSRAGPCANERDGTAGPDRLVGTSAGDRLLGLGGDDVLRGLDGDDCLLGGPGGDRLDGGPGQDLLEGGSGDDTIDAVDGELDTVACGPGADTARVDIADRVFGCERVIGA